MGVGRKKSIVCVLHIDRRITTLIRHKSCDLLKSCVSVFYTYIHKTTHNQVLSGATIRCAMWSIFGSGANQIKCCVRGGVNKVYFCGHVSVISANRLYALHVFRKVRTNLNIVQNQDNSKQ